MSFLLADTHEWVDLNAWIEAEAHEAIVRNSIIKARRELESLLRLTTYERELVREFCNEMLARSE